MGHFYLAFGVILIPFLLVNSILTGSFIEGEVVWYNDVDTLGIRLGTIPIEDAFYAMLLILMNISLFEWFQDRN
jgi:lycopene cyclase domain-containing protein